MDPKNLDYYYKKAKQDGYVARSVYKLEAIDKKYSLFKKKQKVFDLGAAPGSWTSYVAQKVGQTGQVLALDINPLSIAVESNTVFYQEDIHDLDYDKVFEDFGHFDHVISDMAPQTTGIKDRDHIISIELCLLALSVAIKVLHSEGHFICKFFQGRDEKLLFDQAKEKFKYVKVFKPQASQKKSREQYLIAKNLK